MGRNLDDEIGVQGGGDPVQERDGGDDAPNFEAGERGLVMPARVASSKRMRGVAL